MDHGLRSPFSPDTGRRAGDEGRGSDQRFRPVAPLTLPSPPAGARVLGSRIAYPPSPRTRGEGPGMRGAAAQGLRRIAPLTLPSPPAGGEGSRITDCLSPFSPDTGRRAGDEGRGSTRISAGSTPHPALSPWRGARVPGSRIAYPPSPRRRGEGPGMRGAAAQGFGISVIAPLTLPSPLAGARVLGSRIAFLPFSPETGRRAGDEGRGSTRISAGSTLTRPSPRRGRGFSTLIPLLPEHGEKGRG